MAKTLPVCLLVFSLEGLVTQKFSWELVLISYWFFFLQGTESHSRQFKPKGFSILLYVTLFLNDKGMFIEIQEQEPY